MQRTSNLIRSSPAATASGSVANLAKAFANTLSQEQQRALYHERTFANAVNWSNLPEVYQRGNRLGVRTGSFTERQWNAFNALLAAATGSGRNQGYDRIQQQLNADDYLHHHGGGEAYGRGNFFVAFLGIPADTGIWELQFGGHHLALANTYCDGRLVGATPSFRGMEPRWAFEWNGVSNHAAFDEHEALSAILRSLDIDQSRRARHGLRRDDITLGPGRDWMFPDTPVGIAVRQLSDSQRDLVIAAISNYVCDVSDAEAAFILARYTEAILDTHVSYAGSVALNDLGDYIRIDGPSVWIEFSMHLSYVLPGVHSHSIWRDKLGDYGGLGR